MQSDLKSHVARSEASIARADAIASAPKEKIAMFARAEDAFADLPGVVERILDQHEKEFFSHHQENESVCIRGLIANFEKDLIAALDQRQAQADATVASFEKHLEDNLAVIQDHASKHQHALALLASDSAIFDE